MDLRHRTVPCPGPRRRPERRARPQGPPSRAESPASRDLVHGRAPRGAGHIGSGAATASLPAPIARAYHRETVRALGKRRIVIDRHRHRDRKTKTRQAFPAARRAITTRTAIAHVAVCSQQRPDRQRPRPPP